MSLSGSQVTQHSIYGGIAAPYGSFAGKDVLDTPDSTFAVSGTIVTDGQGVESLITAYGKSVSGAIIDTQGVTGTIDADGQGVESLITEYGQTVSGEI